MKVVASSDWRDDLAFETPTLVAEVSPGEPTRCSVCGGSSEPLPRTELWAVKHRHPKQHGGFVRFYCQTHLPVIQRAPAAPARPTAAKPARRAAPRRSTPAEERPRALCPNCFVEVPPTGVCGMCGTEV
ncbi:glucose-6-phosphate dehydrogenase [Microbacterium sp. CFH 31415]|uniref:glucose-6-phosphate dehydrogenase n=1 Tax=Microbacterium sp. CFH 31415 TaxID=2921732 RepID=UPI001F1497AC|nr:glucose-6-phosphate dehydrogenase [Microbacterium sp. CFH 31415]MCH6230147.1 glucose-6-phosphate dehydrogenase [Microbacterium sp. CFH 31415]